MATADDLLRVARSQLGYAEGAGGWTKYGDWYGNGFERAAWCDMFVSWCAERAGAAEVVGRYAYTPYHAGWFESTGRWGNRPRKGAIVFFDWGGSRRIAAIDHVGIVEAVRADGAVVTIEGNTDNAVRRRVRRSGIAGYGYPAYTGDGGSKPGVPAWPGRYLRRRSPMMNGADVRLWQGRVRERGGTIAVDGWYGPESERACRELQRTERIEVDGIVGPVTWKATWR